MAIGSSDSIVENRFDESRRTTSYFPNELIALIYHIKKVIVWGK